MIVRAVPLGPLLQGQASRADSRGGTARLEWPASKELIPPEAMLREIARTVGNADIPLPSAGTEADTVRRYADFAARGHYGLLIHAPGHGDDERVLQALRSHDVSHAQRYRRLIIEDIA